MPKVATPNDRSTPAVLFAAKSTEDVRGSIATQLEDCRAAVEREGGRSIVAEHSDEARSAFKGNRGAGLAAAKRAALAAAEQHGGAELWVQHSDRLARGDGLTADHLAEIFFAMRRANVRLRSVQDDSNLEDAIRAVLIGERNHEDSRRKSEATRSGKRRQFDRGERLGGPVPDGYLLSAGAYTLDAERAPIFAFAFRLAAENPLIGDAEVARRMNQAGYRTKPGKPWRRRRVQDVLTNPWYAGRVARGRSTPGSTVESASGEHPALVDPAIFDAIQATRPARDRAADSSRNIGRPATRYALARLARCARCGEGMYAVTSSYKRKDGTHARHYVCPSAHDSTGGCDQPKIDGEVVDRLVVSGLTGFFVDFDAWLGSVTEVRDERRAGLERSAAADHDRLATLQRREPKLRERWLAAMDAGDDTREGLAFEALEALAREREELRERVSEFERTLASLEEPKPVDALLDFYNGLSAAVRGRVDRTELAEVNAGLRELFEHFTLDTTSEGIQVLPKLRGEAFVLMFSDRDTPIVLDGDGVTLVGGDRPVAWSVLEHDGIVVGDDDDPDSIVSILATGDERIVPPVRRLRTPDEKVSNAHAYL